MQRTRHHHPGQGTGTRRGLALGLAAAAVVVTAATTADEGKPSLDETKLIMGKWIETQQIIAKERNDWQQGREVLEGRIKIVSDEIAALEEKIGVSRKAVAETDAKRGEMTAAADQLVAAADSLAKSAAAMEGEVRKLVAATPEPVLKRIKPFVDRMPTEATTKPVTPAERFQNVLGILNELNKANNEIAVEYEVHTLADGKPAEVQAIYLGLAQAFYVSATGEAGIGRPSANGWTWEPSKAIGNDILKALEIIQGKHTPAFVPVPVKIQ